MTIKLCETIGRNSSSSSHQWKLSYAEWIPNTLSSMTFLLALIGNTAALIVMFGWRGPIRLTNNKYLANLACADLLRACFMPFTIIARMKKNFLFGKMICQILPIVQGLSVGVDIFTLIFISIERYLAICRPLLILKLQSLPFTNLLNSCILIFIWLSALLIALPNFYIYHLCSLPKAGRFKCEKAPPSDFIETVYMIALDFFYFIIPMLVMIVLYTAIIWKMCRNNTATKMRSFQNSNSSKQRSSTSSPPLMILNKYSQNLNRHSQPRRSSECSTSRLRIGGDSIDEEHKYQRTRSISHPNYFQKTLDEKIPSSSSTQGLSRVDRQRRKALKLLIVLIMEFFVCWTPLFIYHTIGTFDKNFYRTTPKVYVDIILFLSFASASCNPMTYYFMSKRYRTVLYAYLPCYSCKKKQDKSRFHHHHQRQPIRLKSRQTY